MSYDIWFEIDAGGPEPISIGNRDFNITSNVAPMWRHAGCDLADLHDTRCADAIQPLRTAIQAMEDDPPTYKAMDPPNGWGDYNGCLQFLRDLYTSCKAHPNAIIKVSR